MPEALGKFSATQLLPSFEKWKVLAKGNSPTYLSYQTPAGVINTITFENSYQSHPGILTDKYQPSILMQRYPELDQYKDGRPSTGFSVHATLRDGYLANSVEIKPASVDYFDRINIYSQSTFLEESSQWKQERGVVLHLNESFLDRLQNLALVPSSIDNSKVIMNAVSVTKSDGEIIATITGYDLNGNPKPMDYPLSYDALKAICVEGNLMFAFEDKVITGYVGDLNFDVSEADPKALDPENIFQVLSGKGKEKFIFPVDVSKKS